MTHNITRFSGISAQQQKWRRQQRVRGGGGADGARGPASSQRGRRDPRGRGRPPNRRGQTEHYKVIFPVQKEQKLDFLQHDVQYLLS